jgi:hypothetical protein
LLSLNPRKIAVTGWHGDCRGKDSALLKALDLTASGVDLYEEKDYTSLKLASGHVQGEH